MFSPKPASNHEFREPSVSPCLSGNLNSRLWDAACEPVSSQGRVEQSLLLIGEPWPLSFWLVVFFLTRVRIIVLKVLQDLAVGPGEALR